MPEDEMQQMLDVSLIGYCILLDYGLLQSMGSAYRSASAGWLRRLIALCCDAGPKHAAG